MMMIALAAILVLWIAAALGLAIAGGSTARTRTRLAVDAALASNEPIRIDQATHSDQQRWAKESVAA